MKKKNFAKFWNIIDENWFHEELEIITHLSKYTNLNRDNLKMSTRKKVFYCNSTQKHNQNNLNYFLLHIFEHHYHIYICIYFCHLCPHHSAKLPPCSFTLHLFPQYLSYYRHHTNYTTEPPTVCTIFPKL